MKTEIIIMGSKGGGMQNYCLTDRVSFFKMKIIMGMDLDGHTTMRMSLMLLKCTPKNGKFYFMCILLKFLKSNTIFTLKTSYLRYCLNQNFP